MFLNPWYSGQPSTGVQALSASASSHVEPNATGSSPVSEENSQPTVSSDPSHELVTDQAHLTEDQHRQLSDVQQSLRPGWTVHLTTESRFYYCNHYNQTSGWLPPSDCWQSSDRLPYGWESAIDPQGKTYFVNHLNKTTTVEDPRRWESPEQDTNADPRTVVLSRDSENGFGFVAGSEKPVIVRFVRAGGPSVNHLMPGDQILKINGEDVRQAPRDHVIQLIRDCQDEVTLEVCQPPLDNTSTRKSALLSAAKKTRLKTQPSRVRFAESVDIDGMSDHCRTSSLDCGLPLMPNVLKVFLENGQTKSFKYDTTTRVQDVINSLQTKLGLVSTKNFSLVVEHVKSIRRNKFTILDPAEHLCRIASRPGVHNLRCLFRVTFYPTDAYELFCQDPQAFEYLFVQCTNDVIQERFSPEIKNEAALKLASLHMYQYALGANGPNTKVTVKSVEKEFGVERFVPPGLLESMKKKEMQKLLTHFLKIHTSPNGHGQKQMTAVQAQLYYLKIISELPSYGAKCFSTNISDSNLESVILISPKFGISQINSLRNGVPVNLCDIEDVCNVTVTREDHVSQKVFLHFDDDEKDEIILTLENRDANELILVLTGYYRLLSQRELEIERDEVRDDFLIPYCSRHQVTCQGWNYPHTNDSDCVHFVNFGAHPPYQPPPPGFHLADSDDSSLWSSSTETTNVDENHSLNDRQGNEEDVAPPKKPSLRFEVVPCKDASFISSEEVLSQKVPQPEKSDESTQAVPDFSVGKSVLTIPPLNKKLHQAPDVGSDGNDFSFGLHSPDNFPREGLTQHESKAFKIEKSNLVAEDLIDLTAFPPPLTPDDEKFLLANLTQAGSSELVETPPTPFADRFLEHDISRSDRNDRNSIGQLSDIESFIAKVAIPPPPGDIAHFNGPTREKLDKDILGFIIPPPPPPRLNLSPGSKNNLTGIKNVSNDISAENIPKHLNSTNDVLSPTHTMSTKVDTAMSTVSSVRSNYSKVQFTDREIQEINVAKETFFKEPKDKISPRIASIHKMLASTGSFQDLPVPADQAADVPDRKKSIPPPPPPPRHGLLLKSSTNKATSVDEMKPEVVRKPPALVPVQKATEAESELEQPPSLPPRVVGNPTKPVLPSPPQTPVKDQPKPVLPSKSPRSLPKTPDPSTKPILKPPCSLPTEKPSLPKKGPGLKIDGSEFLRGSSDMFSKKHLLEHSNNNAKTRTSEIQLNPLKPRAVSGSPLRINQNSSRSHSETSIHKSELHHHNSQNKTAKDSATKMANPGPKHINGCKDVELESGVDSDNENFGFGGFRPAPDPHSVDDARTQIFDQAEEVILRVVAAIDRSQRACASPREKQLTSEAAETYQRAKEQLTNDSRQFVTASKLFVKSATENERQLLECLGHCVHLIDRIGSTTHDVAVYTPSPQQTLGLLVKVKDVAETYLLTVRAAAQAVGRELHDPSMDLLMKRATNLASVLTNLMRTLRVFV